MLGVEDYGSGTESDSDRPVASSRPKSESRAPGPSPSTSLPLPPPKRITKKVTIGLPSLRTGLDSTEDDAQDQRPLPKKPRLDSGAGASSLVSMLPNPTRPIAATERILGSGKGSAFTFKASRPLVNPNCVSGSSEGLDTYQTLSEETEEKLSSVSVDSAAPTSSPLQGIRRNEGVSPDTTDFFSLTTSCSDSREASTLSSPWSASTPRLSSAPRIPDFNPPEPSQTDEYPGYYQLPSGAWAAHDPAYYAEYVKKWQKEYDTQVRALEKTAVKGFEGFDATSAAEVDAMKEMEKSKLEMKIREERKAVTQGARGTPAAPRMTMTASKMSGIARSRHQLSTLLRDAYENREALEEKIAQGKRNRKEAGNKYGF